jgi:hypothetical protein
MPDEKICPLLTQAAFNLQSTLALMQPGPPGATLTFKPVACMKENCEWWIRATPHPRMENMLMDACALKILALKK